MSSTTASVPDVNDLVRVSLGGLEDAEDSRVSDLASRVEDLTRDSKTDKVVSYMIAAPRFSGDAITPRSESVCSLNWHSPVGLWMLPAAFEAQEITDYGLRVWRLRVTGAPSRDQRRQFVRVPWSLDSELQIRRDFEAIAPERRRVIEQAGLLDLVPDLPETIPARAINLSEGGMLCMSAGPALPAHLPLVTRFTLDSTSFVIPAQVVWSVVRDARADLGVENALAFDDPAREGDALRPLLFQAQLRARRAGLV